MASRRAANGFYILGCNQTEETPHILQNRGAIKHMPRGMTLEQKRHVFWGMNMMRKLKTPEGTVKRPFRGMQGQILSVNPV